jgi:hypothetical protein
MTLLTDIYLVLSVYGFRYWKEPGVWVGSDSSGKLQSFVNAVNVGKCLKARSVARDLAEPSDIMLL